jgi:imidazolonepropionase
MPRADLLIHSAAQVITCAGGPDPRRSAALGDAGVLADGAVAISDGRIVAVGPSAEVRAAYPAHETIDATRRILCPGFVDCHSHLIFAGARAAEWEQKLRGVPYLEILAAGGGILSTVRATRAATARHLLAAARSRLDAMLSLGTTTVEIKTGYGLSLESELAHLEIIAQLAQSHASTLLPTLLAAHAVPPEFAGDANGYVQMVCETLIPAAASWYGASPFAAQGAPLFCDAFCETAAFDLAQARSVLEAGREHGLVPKLHVDQFHTLGGAALAVELGAISADHLDVTPAAEMAQLAASNTVAVLLPAVNFHMGATHYADAQGWIEAGAAVALATDFNPGSAPCYSLPLVMALACRHYHMTPAQALNGCTINAAAALGVADRVGSLEVGKEADLLILDLDDYRLLPYWLGINPVALVVKHGRIVA